MRGILFISRYSSVLFPYTISNLTLAKWERSVLPRKCFDGRSRENFDFPKHESEEPDMRRGGTKLVGYVSNVTYINATVHGAD